MLMTHGDDKGIIFPPRVAPLQIVIIPILFKKKKDEVLAYIEEVYEMLKIHFRIKVDMSNHKPGWKQNYWETMGVPIKLEIGPKDAENRSIRVVRRDTFEKSDVEFGFGSRKKLQSIFDDIYHNLYERARINLQESILKPESWDEFMNISNNKKLCLVPFCNKTECEETIKEESGAKSLCIPTDKEYIIDITGLKCIKCDSNAETHCLFGRSY